MNNSYLIGNHTADELASQFGTPLYVYNKQQIVSHCTSIIKAFADYPTDVLYAIKANYNPHLVSVINELGLGIDAVSPYEVRLALELGVAKNKLQFTGNNVSLDDLLYCVENDVGVVVGSLHELELWAKNFPQHPVGVRINPDFGAGHHRHVVTGGQDSKFGVSVQDILAMDKILSHYKLNLNGLHAHIGTGFDDAAELLKSAKVLLELAENYPVEFIDFGGGLKIDYHPSQKKIDVNNLAKELIEFMRRFVSKTGSEPRIKIEPGRWIIANSGYLLTRVTNVHPTKRWHFVGVDTGFNHLIRPTLYGAYHHIVNGSEPQRPLQNVIVAGNICESGDVFTQNNQGLEHQSIAEPRPGDVLVIEDVGAYGMSLASNYNLRALPAEVLIDGADAQLIRRRQSYEDLLAYY